MGLFGIIIGYGIANYSGGGGLPTPGAKSPIAAPTVPTPPSPPSPPGTPPTPPPAPAATRNASELIDDDPFLGDKDAPLTIVEWSDYQCPFCGRFRSQTLDQIKSQYIDTGKVKFVYRDFPLDSIHPNARPAAIAAECAHDQDKFWEYHDKLFADLSAWGSNPAANDVFKGYAKDLGLDESEFGDCVDSRKYDAEVSKDLSDGSANGISGTPGFIVGNQRLSGAQPFASFQAAIDAQLK